MRGKGNYILALHISLDAWYQYTVMSAKVYSGLRMQFLLVNSINRKQQQKHIETMHAQYLEKLILEITLRITFLYAVYS